MESVWLKHNGHNDLIVVFGGWALGAEMFAHLSGPQDVLFVDDYRDLDGLPDLSSYQNRTAVAYSFGVSAFAHLCPAERAQFDRTVAINGSPSPVDRRMGIPPMVYQKTQNGMSQENFQSFAALCYGEKQPDIAIDVAARTEELAAVRQRGPASCPTFDRIWISQKDRIFPPANLARAFCGQEDVIRSIDAPHVPFSAWDSWQEVIA
ncbi:pimeloyl-ACP methyl esterase BioG family protein [Cognatishimia activa]|uniref:pimeloyl-ACP methyl esterase BioG family protein n=1 Tax=Cognatishimia activa TaxID=1715691 RepID=UPI0022301496|nr:pimeloyl-ACP methyl esterase BioG family protein [Cognatishimia activa]UZD91092.1 DUF452 family protein [Cognatishimia activa]